MVGAHEMKRTCLLTYPKCVDWLIGLGLGLPQVQRVVLHERQRAKKIPSVSIFSVVVAMLTTIIITFYNENEHENIYMPGSSYTRKSLPHLLFEKIYRAQRRLVQVLGRTNDLRYTINMYETTTGGNANNQSIMVSFSLIGLGLWDSYYLQQQW